MHELICIVDDDKAFGSAIARLLQLRGYEVAQYGSSDAFLCALKEGVQPACVLLDVRLPDLSGPDLQQRLSELGVSFPVIFLTGYGDVPTTVRAIKAGAEDVLTKPVAEQTLIEAIGGAIRNSLKHRARQEWRQQALTLLNGLTPREREVFDCVVRGSPNKQTARNLSITERTVKAHRQRIFEKLHAKNLTDLVSLAERLEILSPSEDSPAQAGTSQRLRNGES
ncbi:MAG: response regulator transcription factor [Rhizobiaceae bacterium]|nr:response regulator transcription factor [Rhizobiaceae bacterium]